MKKIMTLLLTASMLALASCGDKTSENDPSAKDSSGSVSVGDNSEQENSTPESDEKTDEVSFYDFYGLNMREPDDMEIMPFQGYYIWGHNYETTEKLNYAIVMNSMNYTDSHDPSTYGLDDVWEILNRQLEQNIGKRYSVFELGEAEVSTTEKVDFLGTEFIRSTGSIPFRTYDGEELNIYYSAYYGILDFSAYNFYPEFKSVPIMWIAFSDVKSDEMQAQMDKIVDDVAKNASWLPDES